MKTRIDGLPRRPTGRRLVASLVFAMTLVAVGCGQASKVGEGDHHDPAHRPRDLATAVARMLELHADLSGGTAAPPPKEEHDHHDHDHDHEHEHEHDHDHEHHHHDHPAPTRSEEFRDLVGWIPEFAADSDLDESGWRAACERGEQLRRLIAPLSTDDTAFRAEFKPIADEVRRAIAELEPLAKAAQFRPFASSTVENP